MKFIATKIEHLTVYVKNSLCFPRRKKFGPDFISLPVPVPAPYSTSPGWKEWNGMALLLNILSLCMTLVGGFQPICDVYD